ncbi:MAG: hypothetical protein Q7K13_11695 [Polynucleobacter sp.]|uniref:hypothetical protein n=1 Tax=Polynucleobacter sp. TaxID=2029855 RepID=UPI0027290F5A|nr:hypothetical protein [Polynucleobacter sp.]MDO8715113.1 hypothetical protein [Polynucleobacter sp.]
MQKKLTTNGTLQLNAKSFQRPQMLWHYAPWVYLRQIVAAGSLHPCNALAPMEKALLWFSANQHWEDATGCKAANDSALPARRLA